VGDKKFSYINAYGENFLAPIEFNWNQLLAELNRVYELKKLILVV
jgi:hypothetical protein